MECGRASARCGRVSLECSSMISFCGRVSDCGELESDKLEGAEEGDIVKTSAACSVLGMAGALLAGALKDGKCFRRNDDRCSGELAEPRVISA